MKYDVMNRFTGAVQFTAEIDCREDALPSVKLGLAVRWAYKARANLAGAYLVRANLAGAYLARANLADAYLAGADLAGANLAGADLAGANLAGADLVRADLTGAYLARAYLAGAKIRDGLTLTRAPLFISPIGRDNGTLIAWPTDKGIRLQRGCFFGTVDEFKAASDAAHRQDTPHWRTYRAALALIEAWVD